MSMDRRAQMLQAVLPAERGIREVTDELRWTPSRIISLLRKMKDEGLITEVQNNNVRSSKRGRPKKIMVCTPLGLEFLESYRKLKVKPLRSRKEDFEHAVKDALYTERLVADGHSPFKLFMEVNIIARNIKISSEASQSI